MQMVLNVYVCGNDRTANVIIFDLRNLIMKLRVLVYVAAAVLLVLFLVLAPVVNVPVSQLCQNVGKNGPNPGGPPCTPQGLYDSPTMYFLGFGAQIWPTNHGGIYQLQNI